MLGGEHIRGAPARRHQAVAAAKASGNKKLGDIGVFLRDKFTSASFFAVL